MSTQLTEQLALFEKIKASLPPHRSLIDEVADVLGMGTDGVYRRARGETPLKFEEALRLSRFFNVSLDEINQQQVEDAMLFRRSGSMSSETDFVSYLENMLALVEDVASGPVEKLIYASKDVPIFHLFQFPKLALFKMFFWQKTIFEVPGMESRRFDPFEISDYDAECLRICRRIAEKYTMIPSIEIWNEESTYCELRQVQYYYETGFFKSREGVKAIIEEIETFFQHLKQQAGRGYKFMHDKPPKDRQENYILYYNDLILIDNLIYVQNPNSARTFVIYHNIESLVTDNPQFCKSIDQWLETLTRRSDLISTISERRRNQFFAGVNRRIDELRSMV